MAVPRTSSKHPKGTRHLLRAWRADTQVCACELGTNWGLLILLFIILFSTYMLTYKGLLTSADELSLAAVTKNLVTRGEFNTDQLAWATWEHGWMAQGTAGVDGHIYSKKGIGMSILLAPLYGLSVTLRGIGHTQLLMLFNPLVCALMGVMVMALAGRWGYPTEVGFFLGLLLGLGTIVWPYSQTLFQEPLIGLSLVVMIYAISGSPNIRNMLLAGSMLALAITSKLTNVLAIPLLVLYGLYRLRESGKLQDWQASLWHMVGLLAMPLLALVAIAYYNWFRFGTWTNAGYVDGERFSTPLLQGLSGLLFSSRESLFLFSPILIFAVIGIPLFWKRFRAEAALVFALIVLNLFIFALWYDWRGGLAWGPRFLVSLTPLLIISTLPLFCDWVFVRGGWRRWVFLSIALVSVAVQVAAVSVSYYETETAWPVLTAFTLLAPSHLDIAWTQAGPATEWLMIGLLLGILVAALYLAISTLRRRHRSRLAALSSLGLLLATLVVTFWGLSRIFNDQRPTGGDDYRRLAARLADVTGPNDAIIVDNHIYTEFFLNYSQSTAPHYGFLRSDVLRPEAKTVMENLTRSTENIWLISDRPVYAGLPKPEETWLNQHTFRVGEEAFSDYARLIRYFNPAPDKLTRHVTELTFANGVRLVEHQLTEEETWSPGEVVGLVLAWDVNLPPLTEVAMSLQLVRPDGKLAWQSDTSLSEPETTKSVTNRHAIPIPNNSPPGKYQVLVVLYKPSTGERFQIIAPDYLAGQDAVTLTTLTVE
jgi:hypothetical protein